MNRILNPEYGHVQNQVPHGAAADASNDGEPHEPHHVHALARRDERSGHGEHDGRKDVEEMDETEQVRGIDQGGLHTLRADGSRSASVCYGRAVATDEECAMSKNRQKSEGTASRSRSSE